MLIPIKLPLTWKTHSTMPEFVYDIPTRSLAIWFVVGSLLAVAVGLFIIKPLLRLLLGTGPDFNPSINYVTSGFSLFYGLLLGLLTVAAFQNSERVKESILNEATSLGSLYAQLDVYPEPFRSDVKWHIRDYTLFTIHKEWLAHKEGRILNGGYGRVEAVRHKLALFEPQTDGETIVHAEVISSFQDFTDARQRRLSGVRTAIPPVLWQAVLVGAGVSILFMTILRIRVLQHVLLGSITALFLGIILFVITTLDRPLRGEAALPPQPFETLWTRAMIWDEPDGERF
ncbi:MULTISPECIES: DUF4239 domain-containing protein [unclassified Meridianimarinicoccus]|uniref:bestrophin-like domain n=1 Tax=unclassified Meridianimarinicoccus TaxID=2923344 RepID=UPI001867FD88|nr:DUF4239 domain-containing protein [Fluviibacterium sp. MJW13]